MQRRLVRFHIAFGCALLALGITTVAVAAQGSGTDVQTSPNGTVTTTWDLTRE